MNVCISFKSILVSTFLLTAGHCVYAIGSRKINEAVKNGDVEKVRWLIENNPSLINKKYCGNAPLHLAAAFGHEAVVRLLLGYDEILVNQFSGDGITPLCLAASCGKKEIVRLLLDRDDIQINLQDRMFCLTALNGAVFTVGIMYLLHKNHLDQLVQGDFDRVYNDFLEVIRLLLEHPATQVDLPSNKGSTPLHMAADSGQAEVVRLLLLHNANPTISNNKGKTPLDYPIVQKIMSERQQHLAGDIKTIRCR